MIEEITMRIFGLLTTGIKQIGILLVPRVSLLVAATVNAAAPLSPAPRYAPQPGGTLTISMWKEAAYRSAHP